MTLLIYKTSRLEEVMKREWNMCTVWEADVKNYVQSVYIISELKKSSKLWRKLDVSLVNARNGNKGFKVLAMRTLATFQKPSFKIISRFV